MPVAVVLIGGDIPERRLLEGVDTADLVIAADSGVRIARSHGLPVHVLIGDLDSASEGDRAWATAEGAEVLEFPSNKDATDLELALDHAEAAGVEHIIALGAGGGKLSHELGNWTVLCRPSAAQIEVRTEAGIAFVLHGGHSIELDGSPGDGLSLLPKNGDAEGVTVTGARWPLDGALLPAGTTLGISNEFVDATVMVSLESGTLIVARP